MLDALAHRGPDGAATANDAAAALGCCQFHTTPEAYNETLPCSDADGTLLLTADVRLDNRDELTRLLGAAEDCGDGQLLLAAYSRWGAECVDHLLGAFAFAVWDGPRQRLFCARDHLGIKPFYYTFQTGRLAAFASEIKALLQLEDVPCRVNERFVAQQLVLDFSDPTATSYEGILRLPPGHTLTLSAGGARLESYWELDPDYELELPSDEAYAQRFYELFEEAVRCRLRARGPVGSHLSGGLDSSSVTVVAQRLLPEAAQPLHTLSNVFNSLPSCDERPYIEAVLDGASYEPHYVEADRIGPLTGWPDTLMHEDEAYTGANHYLVWGLSKAAQDAGLRVVLDGFDGDTVVSHGEHRFTELARAQDWDAFAEEARAFQQIGTPVPARRLLSHFAFPVLAEWAQTGHWNQFHRSARIISKRFDIPAYEIWLRCGLRQKAPGWLRQRFRRWSPFHSRRLRSSAPDRVILSPELAARTGIGPVDHPRPRSVREHQWLAITQGGLARTLELYDRTSAAYGVETRHPFLDKRLVEYCLSLPSDQKLRNGWSRWILRQAMKDVLPPTIAERSSKANMEPNTIRGFVVVDREQLDALMRSDLSDAAPYVHLPNVQSAYQRLISRERKAPADSMALWGGLSVALWLKRIRSFDASPCRETHEVV